ncbi:c-type cytochrome [Microbulbifer hainanensis]|uniref:c-type cytochrome n=1 Tax=Microbulbifer hainanensis TaxID=2735675 RepID=UPI0018678D67|nr:cytochrome C [Microbulbifer hainanensis]
MRNLTVVLLMLIAGAAHADEFTKEDVARWQAEYEMVAREGRKLWTSGELGTNGVACAQCHPNAANTHAETYPKFQKQLGRVGDLWEMVNWCIRNPLQGKELAADDPKMIAIVSYIHKERKGVPLAPGKH